MKKNVDCLRIGVELWVSPYWPDNTEVYQNGNGLVFKLYDHHIAGPQLLSSINTLTGSKDKFQIGVSEEGILTVVIEVNDLLPEFIEGE